MNDENTDAKSKDLDLWMIRPCEIYNNEYSECTSISSRLHQMFVHGSTIDCNYWHEDYTNCLKWKNYKNIQAAETLVNSEKMRRRNRWKTFYANDVWKNRTSPPENWNDPLPDYITQRQQNSTLKDSFDETNNKSFCSIM
ncbi:UPF0545 protein C22orf39 homolog [Melanaphis sacchari]|uniref:Synaptic plasticity regulator PANTS n=1 Tax=Melanaphis sacchari TaxID=742174 RepID=A0A2H8TWT4_9HEMI|nr:UPF0545 protein C22orf39 homolog [Melanaphis sacchari]